MERLFILLFISVNEFLNNFAIYLNNNKFTNHILYTHILAGDFNLNLLEESNTKNEYLNILNSHAFISCINEVTRQENNSATCIDHIFLKCKNQYKYTPFILHNKISDHYPVGVSIDIYIYENQSPTKKHFTYTTVDTDKLEKKTNTN